MSYDKSMLPLSPRGASEPYGAEPAPVNPRRAVEGATLVVIAATVVAVVASSWPLFISWIDGARADVARPGIARAIRGRGWAVGPPEAKQPHRLFNPQQRLELPFEGFPKGQNPHAFRGEPSDTGPSLVGSNAKARSIVQLLDRADPDADPVVSVGPDETLMVMRELPPWILLVVKREGHVEFGWTTTNQVVIQR